MNSEVDDNNQTDVWIKDPRISCTIRNWIKDTRISCTIRNWIKNGYYIPPLHAVLYYITGSAFTSSAIAMKIYPANYFYWFGQYYDFQIPKKYNWIKQFVRFTDTGYLASYIYLYDPAFFPIAYNVHYTITMGYWIGKIGFDMQNIDLLDFPDLNRKFELTWTSFNHGLILALLTYETMSSNMCYGQFSWSDLQWSYYWMYAWFFAIYLPWRFTTGDCVYGILSNDVSLQTKIAFILVIHGVMGLGNITGYLIR